jgi:hypothetical protein
MSLISTRAADSVNSSGVLAYAVILCMLFEGQAAIAC